MQRGFTLIELMITIALAVILSYGGLLMLVSFRGRQDLAITSRLVVATLRDAQARSISQEEGKLWGVRFDASGRTYSIFYGSTCSPETFVSTTNIKANLEFTDPASGVKDVCFKKVSGLSTASSPVTVTLGLAADPTTTDTLTIYQNGRIE